MRYVFGVNDPKAYFEIYCTSKYVLRVRDPKLYFELYCVFSGFFFIYLFFYNKKSSSIDFLYKFFLNN